MTVENEAKKAGADISGCSIVDPQVCEISRCSPSVEKSDLQFVSPTTRVLILAHYIHSTGTQHTTYTQSCSRIDKYVDALVEARKKKGISREAATDQVTPGDARG